MVQTDCQSRQADGTTRPDPQNGFYQTHRTPEEVSAMCRDNCDDQGCRGAHLAAPENGRHDFGNTLSVTEKNRFPAGFYFRKAARQCLSWVKIDSVRRRDSVCSKTESGRLSSLCRSP